MSAPMGHITLWKNMSNLLIFSSLWVFLQCNVEDYDVYEHLLCRQCGHEVTKASSLKTVPSALAKRQRNDTILGVKEVLIQLFENPKGNHFEVITSSAADVLKADDAYTEYSWFPGFSWTVCLCPRCGFHLGWYFHPETPEHKDSKSFIGLILANLIHKDYADSLLITPKSYLS